MNAMTRLPALSQPLATAVDAELRRPAAHPDAGPQPVQPIAPHLAAEAERMARAAQAAMMPASADDIAAWIGPLNAACRNPQSAGDIAAWAMAVSFAADRIPRQAFGPDALRDLMAKSPFFPAAADVMAIVQPEANRLAAKLRALRAIASRPTTAPAKPEPDAKPFALTPEQQATLAAMKAPKRAAAVTAAARPAHPAVLLAGYREQLSRGGLMADAARIRIAKLEADFPELAEAMG
jgi:hypothetical protein